MEELKPGWQVKGTYNEACAAEGHCPEGCMAMLQVFRKKWGTDIGRPKKR